MQLRFLLITGPSSEPATIEFGPGLNVIYGGSNTGKSHILQLIDYVLGASTAPEPIVEQAGYDVVQLGVLLDDGTEITLARALQGGDIRVIEGFYCERVSSTLGKVVSAKHSAKTSLSKLLLEKLGASGTRVRTDANGKTRDLSFRDLGHHILIDEGKIQEKTSPLQSGQYTTKTVENAIFKYILTGVDDSALDIAKPENAQPLRKAAQLELLDQQIRELDRQISESDDDHEDLIQLDNALNEQLAKSFEIQESTEASYRELTSRRRELRRENEGIQDRIGEIETLLSRFQMLSQHYSSDQRRLAAIIEAGSFFMLEGATTCPICGSDPLHHRSDHACEGNVEDIVRAATAESEELKERANELQFTILGLQSEQQAFKQRNNKLLDQLESLYADIVREVPSVQTVRFETSRVLQQKIGINKSLGLVQRRDTLVSDRSALGISPGYDSSTMVAKQQLDGGILDTFSQVVEKELQSWEFPDAKRVFFELTKMDISVAGKSRSANGKGVRALLHGAFSIALMKYCRTKKRAHPGFLVLDSLFITYRDPEDAQEKAIASTPLKDRAFQAFSKLPNDLQLIVLENVDVPDWLLSQKQCTHFTGEPSVGRAGLFPLINITKP